MNYHREKSANPPRGLIQRIYFRARVHLPLARQTKRAYSKDMKNATSEVVGNEMFVWTNGLLYIVGPDYRTEVYSAEYLQPTNPPKFISLQTADFGRRLLADLAA